MSHGKDAHLIPEIPSPPRSSSDSACLGALSIPSLLFCANRTQLGAQDYLPPTGDGRAGQPLSFWGFEELGLTWLFGTSFPKRGLITTMQAQIIPRDDSRLVHSMALLLRYVPSCVVQSTRALSRTILMIHMLLTRLERSMLIWMLRSRKFIYRGDQTYREPRPNTNERFILLLRGIFNIFHIMGIGRARIIRSVKMLTPAPARQSAIKFPQLPFCLKFQLRLTGLHSNKLAATCSMHHRHMIIMVVYAGMRNDLTTKN